VAAAVRANELTVEKADILIDTFEKLRPSEDVEARFVRLAKRLRPHDLRRACARELVVNDPAGTEQREREQYEQRYLNFTERLDGMVEVQGLLDKTSAGEWKAWIDAQTRSMFQAKRETPWDVRTPGQMRVDAMVMLAHHALKCDAPGSGVATTMVVRIDEESLRSRMGVGTCDSLQTPISASTLRAMAVDAGILPAVMGGASLPCDVGRTRRGATPAQRIALVERDGGCAWCHAPASYCDVHHIKHWLFGGKTDLNNLVMLCVSCHHQIHFGRWRIEVKQGEVWFTPPADFDPTRTPRKGGLADLELAA
jgi:5-methylcytosine-specific restriction protein A